jgi:hypothetical protein
VPRIARLIDSLPAEVLEAAAVEFLGAALKALEGQIPNRRELADRLGWSPTTVHNALKGHFTFSTWPKICRALERDPIDELVRGRAELIRSRADLRVADREREDAYRVMVERAEGDTMVVFWRRLSLEERGRVARLLVEELIKESSHEDTE